MLRRTFLKHSATSFAAVTLANAPAAAFIVADSGARNYRTALELLRSSFQGTLVLPGDPAYPYSDWAHSANARFNSVLPLAIAFCESANDVSKCIRWSEKVGVPLAPKGGGHNYEGASTTTGLLIITRRMNRIKLNPAMRAVVVEAGALNGELLQVLKAGSLMLPIGTCPQVGVCGLTLGGGIGENSRWAGMTCDSLRSTKIVLANGDLVTASDRSYSDLFWACRGAGGGNFGIHTELTFDLSPLVSPVTSAIWLIYEGSHAAIDVFHAVDNLMQTAPDTLNGFIFLRTNPSIGTRPSPDVPAGQRLDPKRFPVTEVQLNYQGPLNELLHLIRTVLNAAKPVLREQTTLKFWQAQLTWLAVPDQPPHGLSSVCRFANKALSTSTVNDLVAAVVDAPFAQRSKNASVELMCWAGGVVQNVAPDATAYVHRNSTTIPRISTWWLADTPLAQQRQLLNWMRGAYGIVQRDSQNQSFQNFPSSLVTGWRTAYYGKNLPRLVQVKKRYDPQNVFNHAQSIPLNL